MKMRGSSIVKKRKCSTAYRKCRKAAGLPVKSRKRSYSKRRRSCGGKRRSYSFKKKGSKRRGKKLSSWNLFVKKHMKPGVSLKTLASRYRKSC